MSESPDMIEARPGNIFGLQSKREVCIKCDSQNFEAVPAEQ